MEFLQNLDIDRIIAILGSLGTIIAAIIAFLQKVKAATNAVEAEKQKAVSGLLIQSIEDHTRDSGDRKVKNVVYNNSTAAGPEMKAAVAQRVAEVTEVVER